MSTKEQLKTMQDREIELLREYLKDGQTVYTVLRHVSASGLSKDISLMTITGEGEPIKLTYSLKRAGAGFVRGCRGVDHAGVVGHREVRPAKRVPRDASVVKQA